MIDDNIFRPQPHLEDENCTCEMRVRSEDFFLWRERATFGEVNRRIGWMWVRFKRLIWLHIFFGTSWCNPPRNEMIYTKIIQKKRIIKIHNRGLSQKKIPKKGLIPDKKSTIPDTFKISSVEYAHFLHVFFRVFWHLAKRVSRKKKHVKKGIFHLTHFEGVWNMPKKVLFFCESPLYPGCDHPGGVVPLYFSKKKRVKVLAAWACKLVPCGNQ